MRLVLFQSKIQAHHVQRARVLNRRLGEIRNLEEVIHDEGIYAQRGRKFPKGQILAQFCKLFGFAPVFVDVAARAFERCADLFDPLRPDFRLR